MTHLRYQNQLEGLNQSTVDLRSAKRLIFSKTLNILFIRALCLIALDALALSISRYLAESLSFTWNPTWSFQENPTIIFLIIGIHLIIFYSNGLYRSGKNRRNYPVILKSVSVASMLILLIAFLYLPNSLVTRSTFLFFWAFSFLFVSLGRYIFNLGLIKLNQVGFFLSPIFVITDSEKAKDITDLMKSCRHYKICGWDTMQSLSNERIDATIRHLQVLGVLEVYIHSSGIQDPMYIYWKLQNAGITLYLLPEDLTPVFRDVELSYIHYIPCFKLNEPSISGVGFLLKRSLDFLCALIFLIALSPLYIGLAALIFLDNPGAIFYRQLRVGLHGRSFKVWKFRTMVANADQLQTSLEANNESQDGILFKIKDDPRVTRLGKILRRYSLDELPQIFNVLLGEMSFIGPRPLPLRDVERFSQRHHIRHEVLPGITGLWQVSGRSDIQNFDDVLQLDVQYIERWSIWLDLKILLKTIFVIINKSGAY